MKRRDFITVWAMALAPAFARGQSAPAVRRIAILDPADDALRAEEWQVLIAALRTLGHAEGRNLVVDRRFAGGVTSRLPSLARELLAGKPEVVLVVTTPATRALMELSDKVPIVMTGTADPVATGLVSSLARPGRNVTGVSVQLADVAKKRLDLMRELVPGARRFGLLGPAANEGIRAVHDQLRAVAQERGLEVRIVDAADAESVARAFARLASEPVDALLVTQVMNQHLRQIVELTARHRIPAGYVDEAFLDAGGLLVFGPDRNASYRLAAGYVQRILEGANPADMPVVQPTEFWLGVNQRTAKTLGLAVPQSILLRANRVIPVRD